MDAAGCENIKLIIAYEGTDFLGWQKTNVGRSVEETLQTVIEKILQHPVNLQAASRTDAGVHAKGQVVNFFTPKKSLDLERFKTSLNCLLSKEIAVLQIERMPALFHPTLDSTGKEYAYFLCLGKAQLPHFRRFSWHVPYPLDLEVMEQAAAYFLGEKDFSALCNAQKNSQYKDKIRRIEKLSLVPLEENRLSFRIRGNHFLYKMVRNIVGTLVDIGKGKVKLEELASILSSKSRPKAGVTAPAHGLFLERVFY